jgi:hypothetical protein
MDCRYPRPLRAISLAILLISGISAQAQISIPAAGVLSTIAGTGAQTYSGDGGLATAAGLNAPGPVAIDTAGNIYFIDQGNAFRIRKITAATGIITTIAGNSGTMGYTGDGGPATAAEFWEPIGIAVDTQGNVYIGDTGNNRIREITASTGIITTIAGSGYSGGITGGFSGDGGLATSAALNAPTGLAVDATGNIYVVDGQSRVRKITASTGIITTVAGNGTFGYSGDGGPATAAAFNQPYYLALDAAGNIYVADSRNSCIRKVTVATGDISTVAGNTTFGYSGDGGPATAASFDVITSVASTAAGDLYIADAVNYRVRKVTAATGIITTVAGTGLGGAPTATGPATSVDLVPVSVGLDAAQNLYITDSSRIYAVGATTVTTTPTYAVTVTSSNSTPTMGETVVMTATIVNSQNLPVSTGTVAWVNSGTGTSLGQSTVDSSGVATLSLPLSKVGPIIVTANYLATNTTISATGSLELTVSGITVTPPTTPPTIPSGGTGTVALGIAPIGGYTGAVTLTCSGIPSPGSCSLSPSTLSFTSSSTSQTTTLTVNTGASTTSELRLIPGQPVPAKSGRSKPGISSIVLALLCPLLHFSRRSRQVTGIKALLLLLLSAGVLTMATTGCSGGTSPAPSATSTPAPSAPSNPGIAAGTYTVNVVAQAGSASITIPVSVTVQ